MGQLHAGREPVADGDAAERPRERWPIFPGTIAEPNTPAEIYHIVSNALGRDFVAIMAVDAN